MYSCIYLFFTHVLTEKIKRDNSYRVLGTVLGT